MVDDAAAVDPEAHQHVLPSGSRFDVDVGGVFLVRLADDLVDQLDDDAVLLRDPLHLLLYCRVLRRVQLAEEVGDGGGRAIVDDGGEPVVVVDEAPDVLPERPHEADPLALLEDEFDQVLLGQVGRVLHGDLQHAVVDLHRDPALLLQSVRLHPFQDVVQPREVRVEGDELGAEVEAQALGHLVPGDVEVPHQEVVEPDGGGVRMGRGLLYVGLLQQVLVQKVVVARLVPYQFGGSREPEDVLDGDGERGSQLDGVAQVRLVEDRGVLLVDELHDPEELVAELHRDAEHLPGPVAGLLVPVHIEGQFRTDHPQLVAVVGVLDVQHRCGKGAVAGEAVAADRDRDLLDLVPRFHL